MNQFSYPVMESNHPTWLTRLLALGHVYEVGGSVRDGLITSPSTPRAKDRDYLVTSVEFDTLCNELEKFGRVDLVGRSFGVIKFTPRRADSEAERVTYDIALPRSERSTGEGHRDFAVAFDPSLPVEVDLGRRDFTINAMARDVANGELVDPSDGQKDLRAGVIRQVFPETFREDPLRMLRAVQFAARFEFKIEDVTAAAIRSSAPLIKSVSPERIADELTKLLILSEQPSIGLRLMLELSLLGHVLPETLPMVGCEQPGGYHAFDVFEHSLRVIDAAPKSLRLRWAALLHDVEKPQCRAVDGDKATFYRHESYGEQTARQVLSRLRYPHALIDEVALLIAQHMFVTSMGDKGVRRLIRRMGTELVYDLLELRRVDVIGQGMGNPTDDVDELERRITAEIEKKSPFGIKDLAVNGDDIMRNLGLAPGPLVGKLLDALLETVLDDPSSNDRDRLIERARNLFNDNK